ncbi:MAG: AIR carboxylase family protein [Candidatus Omnitrophota bacterium]
MAQRISVLAGSKSDLKELKPGFDILDEMKIPYTVLVISAHRNPEKLREFCLKLDKDCSVVIACAGMAAALPGFVASYVNIPVIGVALKGGILNGLDALFAIVSTPRGLGVASTGLGKSAFINAIIMSLEIMAVKDPRYLKQVTKLKNKFK